MQIRQRLEQAINEYPIGGEVNSRKKFIAKLVLACYGTSVMFSVDYYAIVYKVIQCLGISEMDLMELEEAFMYTQVNRYIFHQYSTMEYLRENFPAMSEFENLVLS